MKKILFIISLFIGSISAQSGFYREYWGEFDSTVSNQSDKSWRVSDPELSLHPSFGPRWEARPNGLAILDVPEDLFGLSRTELYMELWGGHPLTINKKVSINGKGSYNILGYGTETGNCTYSYPTLEIAPQHMVTGKNAVQFSCERGESFWGHFLMNNISIRCYLNPDHKDLKESGLDSLKVSIDAPCFIENETANIKLKIDEKYASQIERVEYFAKYSGFDDNGNGIDDDWHSYTFKRKYTNNPGLAEEYPYSIDWNTELIPDQSKPIPFRAIIYFNNGMKYITASTKGSVLNRENETVTMFYCNEMPVPFWSRANNLNIAKTYIPFEMENVVKAELLVKVWDGGEGNVKEPFNLNGHPYTIHSGVASHDVVFTKVEIAKEHLEKGWNEFNLLSDTEHHGIEMLLPGPAIIIRSKK